MSECYTAAFDEPSESESVLDGADSEIEIVRGASRSIDRLRTVTTIRPMWISARTSATTAGQGVVIRSSESNQEAETVSNKKEQKLEEIGLNWQRVVAP